MEADCSPKPTESHRRRGALPGRIPVGHIRARVRPVIMPVTL
jgi:hypothetical protein